MSAGGSAGVRGAYHDAEVAVTSAFSGAADADCWGLAGAEFGTLAGHSPIWFARAVGSGGMMVPLEPGGAVEPGVIDHGQAVQSEAGSGLRLRCAIAVHSTVGASHGRDSDDAQRQKVDLNLQFNAYGLRPADDVRPVEPAQLVEQLVAWEPTELDTWLNDGGRWYSSDRDRHVTLVPRAYLPPTEQGNAWSPDSASSSKAAAQQTARSPLSVVSD